MSDSLRDRNCADCGHPGFRHPLPGHMEGVNCSICYRCGGYQREDFKVEPPTLKFDPPILSLRDRIAAAITGIRIQRDGDSYRMADAVMEVLGLREERTSPYRDWPNRHRYVTEWEPTHE